MAIQLHTQPKGGTFVFNESRLKKIVKATSLEQAQKMGLFDRMFDRGGVKKQAIRELYESINNPASHDSQPVDLLTRFYRLRELADPERHKDFRVHFSKPDEHGEWSFALSLVDAPICVSPADLRDVPGTSFDAFFASEKADQLHLHATQLAKNIAKDRDLVLGGRSQTSFAAQAIQFASDDPAVRLQLKENLSNPLCCSDNFKGVSEGENPATFKVHFESQTGERVEWELSNRAGSEGEFRGERLKQALSQGKYQNLAELFGASFEGPDDRHIQGLIRMKVRDFADGVNGAVQGSSSAEDLLDDILQLQETHPQVAAKICETLRETQVGKTHVLEVLYRERAPSVVSTGVAGLLHQFGQPGVDIFDHLRDGIKLGRFIEAEVTHDPERRHLAARLKPESDRQLQKMSNEQLLTIYRAFIKDPILIRSDDHTLGAIRDVVSDGHIDPDDPELTLMMQHAHPLSYASDVLKNLFEGTELELKTRGQHEQILNPQQIENLEVNVKAPPQFESFLNHHIVKRLDFEQAVKNAIDGGPSAEPLREGADFPAVRV